MARRVCHSGEHAARRLMAQRGIDGAAFSCAAAAAAGSSRVFTMFNQVNGEGPGAEGRTVRWLN